MVQKWRQMQLFWREISRSRHFRFGTHVRRKTTKIASKYEHL
jgi:hypothetical protein